MITPTDWSPNLLEKRKPQVLDQRLCFRRTVAELDVSAYMPLGLVKPRRSPKRELSFMLQRYVYFAL